MQIRGRVRNGVVILEEGPSLPEGLGVTVVCPDPQHGASGPDARPVRLPLVPSRRPGSIDLTAERIAELLEEADVSA